MRQRFATSAAEQTVGMDAEAARERKFAAGGQSQL
jgi:hypothetical protein